MTDRTAEEIETSFYQNAADRKTWQLFTEDAFWIRRMEAIGAELVTEHGGGGRTYKLRADQVLVRKGKRQMSEAQRAQSSTRMRELVANQRRARDSEAQGGTE